MTTASRWVLGLLVAFSILPLIFATYISADNDFQGFLEISIVDILGLFWSGALALWLTSVIRERDNAKAKTRELVDNAIRDYEERLLRLLESAETYARADQGSQSMEIQSASKRARQSLGALVDLLTRCDNQLSLSPSREQLQREYTQFNASITDDFLTADSAQRLALFAIAESKHEQLRNSLLQLRYSVYNGNST